MNTYVIYNCPLIQLNLLNGETKYINPIIQASSEEEAKNIVYNSFSELNFPFSGTLNSSSEWIVKII